MCETEFKKIGRQTRAFIYHKNARSFTNLDIFKNLLYGF